MVGVSLAKKRTSPTKAFNLRLRLTEYLSVQSQWPTPLPSRFSYSRGPATAAALGHRPPSISGTDDSVVVTRSSRGLSCPKAASKCPMSGLQTLKMTCFTSPTQGQRLEGLEQSSTGDRESQPKPFQFHKCHSYTPSVQQDLSAYHINLPDPTHQGHHAKPTLFVCPGTAANRSN